MRRRETGQVGTRIREERDEGDCRDFRAGRCASSPAHFKLRNVALPAQERPHPATPPASDQPDSCALPETTSRHVRTRTQYALAICLFFHVRPGVAERDASAPNYPGARRVSPNPDSPRRVGLACACHRWQQTRVRTAPKHRNEHVR